MRLEGRAGTSLELTVLRYQFAGGDNEWDLNWLIVRGYVVKEDRSWTFEDPCLLASEAWSLGSWLRHAANPLAEYERLGFIEPNLLFDGPAGLTTRSRFACTSTWRLGLRTSSISLRTPAGSTSK